MTSIFKQKVYRSEYILTQRRAPFHTGFPRDEIFSLEKGNLSLVCEKPLIELELEPPLLEVGENFYIEEEGRLVTIKSKVRSSKENVVYYIEDEVLGPEEGYEEVAKSIVEQSRANKENIFLRKEVEELRETVKKYEAKTIKKFWRKNRNEISS